MSCTRCSKPNVSGVCKQCQIQERWEEANEHDELGGPEDDS